MPDAVIVATGRTPIGRANKGSLVSCRPDDLAALVIKEVLAKVPKLDPSLIEDVMFGCGQPAGEASNMAKYAAAEGALAALDAAIQCHGGNGVATEHGLIPLWGLARVLRIAPVNREMILNFVAQHSLGLPRSY